MASKTSASVGMMVSLAVFALLSLVLFVLTVVFAASTQKMTRERDEAVADLAAAVKPNEKDDRWEELKRQAGTSTGVVRYLDNSLRDTLKFAGGVRTLSLKRQNAAHDQQIRCNAFTNPFQSLLDTQVCQGEIAAHLALPHRDHGLDGCADDLTNFELAFAGPQLDVHGLADVGFERIQDALWHLRHRFNEFARGCYLLR